MNHVMRDWSVGTWIAALALAVAVGLDVVVLIPASARSNAPALVLPSPTAIPVRSIDGADMVRDAANQAPFGASMASLPQFAQSGILSLAPTPVPAVRPRLLGTVVERDGGFVVLEMPDARVQVVRIGERAGEMRLRSVAAGEAIFDDARDGRITLRTSQPGRPDTRP